MAGTDTTRRDPGGGLPARGPAVILVDPQLGENIGMAARAMLNCALTELRLVRPRDGWPNEKALAASAGAADVIEGARIFETTAEAVADLERVYGATARPRDMNKTVFTPHAAAAHMKAFMAGGGRSGVLFGAEAKGLNNDDVTLCDAVLEVPLNPGFRSLNLAQAVFAMGYEWFLATAEGLETAPEIRPETRPATKAELIGLFEHLEKELDACGFLRIEEKRPAMVRNLRNIFQRAGMTDQEVRTLRGVIAGLVKGRTP